MFMAKCRSESMTVCAKSAIRPTLSRLVVSHRIVMSTEKEIGVPKMQVRGSLSSCGKNTDGAKFLDVAFLKAQ